AVVTDFLRSSFTGSTDYEEPTKEGLLILGFGLGTVLALLGIAIAHRLWVVRPGTATRLRERLGGVYQLLAHAWYFDELIDALVVPIAMEEVLSGKGNSQTRY